MTPKKTQAQATATTSVAKNQKGTTASQDIGAIVDFEMPPMTEEFPELPIDTLPGESEEDTVAKAVVEVEKIPEKEVDSSARAVEEALRQEREEEEKRKKEYLEIFDTLMFEGTYEESVKLGSKYKALYRTRTTREDNDISKRLDSMNFKTAIAYQNMASIMTLMYSLKQFNAINVTEMAVQDRYAYLCGLPGPILVLLSNQLFKFDQKVLEAVAFGKENF